MRHLVPAFTLLVLGIAGSIGIASADLPKPTLGFALRALQGFEGTPAPPEWSGIWDTVDSTYIPCEIPIGITSSSADTICTGETFDPSDPGYTLTCSGNVDATTFHLECTGTADLGGGCTGTVDLTFDGTRTNDTYRTVSVFNFTPDTPSDECIAICIRTVSYGTRTGPAPEEYCTTEAKPSSWGRLKTLYR